MVVVFENVQYFEDNLFIMDEYKKKDVVGIIYCVVVVVGEFGDVFFVMFIGVNLFNVNWICVKYGFKLVSLGNIIQAYEKVDGFGLLQEFFYDEEEMACVWEYGFLGGKMYIVFYEVVGYVFG